MTDDDRSGDHIDDLCDLPDLDVVLGALAEPLAQAPPSATRRALLSRVRARPRPGAEPLPVEDLYARRAAATAALLRELRGVDWTAQVAPYAWTVRRLVAHLTALEELTASQMGLTDRAPVPAGDPAHLDHLRLGEDLEPEANDALVERWHHASTLIVTRLGEATFDPSDPVPLHGWPFDASTALVVRAFELWTHADDIRRATRRPLEVPDAQELRTMSMTSVASLPTLLALRGEAELAPTRIVLTGPGGGTFDLGRAGAEPHAAVLITDVVAYCRLVARRVEPVDLDATRQGDTELVDALLRAARSIAV